MHYKIWEFFYLDGNLSLWQERLKGVELPELATCRKVWEFLSALIKQYPLQQELGKAQNIEQFMEVAANNGYHFSQEELGWFLIGWQQIWKLFNKVQENLSLQEQLRKIKSTPQLLELAAKNNCSFSLEQLRWLLTEIKSGGTLVQVSINNDTGDIFFISNWGKVRMGTWVNLGEELGLARPLCNLSDRGSFHFFKEANMEEPNWKLLGKCFLPKGYFSRD